MLEQHHLVYINIVNYHSEASFHSWCMSPYYSAKLVNVNGT